MKLIITDYIASLKEEKELDSLIVELLREFNIEIVSPPKKGERQQGVDIYAVGEDWTDGVRKVFLLTVKQGNFDRKNWEGTTQSLMPSLVSIVTSFVRNRILPEHASLPIKIVVVHNGVNESGILESFTAFADNFSDYTFDIWSLDTLVPLVQEKLINENVFSDKAKRALRKIIIQLANHDYDFSDFTFLLDEILLQIDIKGKSKKHNIRQLRKASLILSIIVAYCEQEEDLRLAIRATEIAFLRVWKSVAVSSEEADFDYMTEFIKILLVRKDLFYKYLEKTIPVCMVKDGFSRECKDSVNYCLIAYEHLGIISTIGLELLQTAELFKSDDEISTNLTEHAKECAGAIINMFNHNQILFIPRLDNHIIEISLVLSLFYKLNRLKDIKTVLLTLANEISQAKEFFNIAPHFRNNIDKVFELDIFTEKRKDYKYKSSSLLPTLAEWSAVINDEDCYNAYKELISKHFPDTELIIWFPDEETEASLFTECSVSNTGYCLSNVTLENSFSEFRAVIKIEFENNCFEKEFLFMEQNLWIIGLVASRHFRTYIFPYYWRQFIQ